MAATPRQAARWQVRPPAPPQAVRALARALGTPPLLASVLYARGLGDTALASLQPPLALTGIPTLGAAAERLEHALRAKRRILIHGDYDADGISGTAVLTLGLRALGGNVTPFIPDRLSEGYGIYPGRVPEHAERAEVFVSVDCGISNLDEIAALQAAGVEVIITDHHQPGEVLPDCLVVHPKLSPAARAGLPELTGAGVAYHLLWALHERLGLEAPLEYADLATLGVVADVAPLLGENRALVQAGLARMAASSWPGVRAMVAQSRLKGAPTARDVAFVLAPRLNAAGRLGEADKGLELLMTASERRARELAVYLDARNQERRQVQDEMYQQAFAAADPDAPALVLEDARWHPGVMGIVASKLLEHFYKPVFIMAQGKGSVRSTPGISAVGGLRAASAHLKRYGGHTAAAGFAILEQSVAPFREAIYRYVGQHPPPERTLTADLILDAHDIDSDLWKAIRTLEPYGEGHPEPAFLLSEPLEAARAVGKNGGTLQLRLGGLKGVAWQRGDLATTLAVGAPHDAVVSLRENTWNERTNLEFLAEDVRERAPLPLVAPLPAEAAPRFRRGTPPPGSTGLHLRELPLSDDPLTLCHPLAEVYQGEAAVWLELDAAALSAAEAALAELPTLQDVRRAYLCRQRGHPLPFADPKATLVARVLEELELVDGDGRPVRGVKRDPYSSDTLLDALTARYTLRSFLHAYRHLDDDAFGQAMAALFGECKAAISD